MNRKNTILLAVFINAAMLIVLFATALTSQEEIALAPTHEISRAAPVTPQTPAPPMFGDELDFILRTQATPSKTTTETLPQVQLADSLYAKAETPSIVHALPPMQSPAAEIPAVSAPVAARVPETTSSFLKETSVKSGDTLEKIARAHHTTVDEIITLNHLPSSFLRVGQVLKLPAEKTSVAKAQKNMTPDLTPNLTSNLTSNKSVAGPDYYTVKVGDNPWMIAVKHHLKVEELLKLNGLNEEKARKLKPGDRLRIK